MELYLMIAAITLPVAIVVYTIIFRYSTLRRVKVITFLISAIVSVLLIGFCLYIVISDAYDPTSNMWAVGICGLLLGFWLKRPGSDLD